MIIYYKNTKNKIKNINVNLYNNTFTNQWLDFYFKDTDIHEYEIDTCGHGSTYTKNPRFICKGNSNKKRKITDFDFKSAYMVNAKTVINEFIHKDLLNLVCARLHNPDKHEYSFPNFLSGKANKIKPVDYVYPDLYVYNKNIFNLSAASKMYEAMDLVKDVNDPRFGLTIPILGDFTLDEKIKKIVNITL